MFLFEVDSHLDGLCGLGAAALTQDGWAHADVLWIISLIAIAYSAQVAIIAAGKQRATAVGFAVFACVFLVPVVAAPESMPSQRLLVASGVEVGDTVAPAAATGAFRSIAASGAFTPSSGSLSYAAHLSVTIASPPSRQPYTPPTGQAFKSSGRSRLSKTPCSAVSRSKVSDTRSRRNELMPKVGGMA